MGALLAYPVVRRPGRRTSLAATLVLSGTLVLVTVAAERFLDGERAAGAIDRVQMHGLPWTGRWMVT